MSTAEPAAAGAPKKRMTLTARGAAVAVAALIVIAGGAYDVKHHRKYQSSAAFLLAPAPGTTRALATAELGDFTASGTAGTFVDLIDSPSTLRQAGVAHAGVTLAVRADPTARVIYVTAQGPEDVVQPALTRVIATALRRQSLANDVFTLAVIDTASRATAAGPSRSLLAIVVVLLALLGGLFVYVVLRRYPPAIHGAIGPGGAAD